MLAIYGNVYVREFSDLFSIYFLQRKSNILEVLSDSSVTKKTDLIRRKCVHVGTVARIAACTLTSAARACRLVRVSLA